MLAHNLNSNTWEVKASLVYIMSSRLTALYKETLSKTKNYVIMPAAAASSYFLDSSPLLISSEDKMG